MAATSGLHRNSRIETVFGARNFKMGIARLEKQTPESSPVKLARDLAGLVCAGRGGA